MSGSIADLEKEVANLQKKLKEETDKTQEVQKQGYPFSNFNH